MRKFGGRPLMAAIILSLIIPATATAAGTEGDEGRWGGWGSCDDIAEITLLHTNDFHGNLETDYQYRGGAAYLAEAINDIRDEVGERDVALMDAGDEFFAAPAISQLLMGESTIDIFNRMGYDLAVFGNHEFDKGKMVLNERVAQSEYPWLGANVVLEGTDWDLPGWSQPYEILQLGTGCNKVKVGVIGVATDETPQVTLLGTTAGLEFKDLTETISHYYDEVLAQADALIVVAHMGTDDSGPYKGLETIAQELINAGQPVDLMIGGHQHQDLTEPIYVGDTAIVAAGYYGRFLGRVDVSVDKGAQDLEVLDYELLTITGGPSIDEMIEAVDGYFADGSIDKRKVYNRLIKRLEVIDEYIERGGNWLRNANKKLRSYIKYIRRQSPKHITPEAADALVASARSLRNTADLAIVSAIGQWADVVAPIVNQPVVGTNIDLIRDYNAESSMGDIVTDSMLWKADWYDDGALNGSVDIAFTNPGGLRADILIPAGAALPITVTWGATFSVLPFGNTLYYMDLTGAQIRTLLNQSANLYKGILQTSGATWYWYNDTLDDNPSDWGAYDIEVGGVPLDDGATYRIVTNNFLAGGQDGWVTFADGTNRWDSYYDMQAGFVEYLGTLPDGTIDAADIPMDRIIYMMP